MREDFSRPVESEPPRRILIVKRQSGTKLYYESQLEELMRTQNSGMDVRDEQRLNLRDRIQADLEDGGFNRLEFVCVGMRQVLFGDLAADVIVNELRVGEVQYENEYKHKGKPAKRILIEVKKDEVVVSGKMERAG
jgi:hypothetical protein